MPHSARADVGAAIIVAVQASSNPTPVWNLTIDGTPEYLANGVLTHNCTWVPGMKSPDRLDAMVWALTELMVMQRGELRVLNLSDEASEDEQAAADRAKVEAAADVVTAALAQHGAYWPGGAGR